MAGFLGQEFGSVVSITGMPTPIRTNSERHGDLMEHMQWLCQYYKLECHPHSYELKQDGKYVAHTVKLCENK